MNEVKVKILLPDYKDLLKYGNILSDNQFGAKKKYTRVIKIEYMGILYHLKIVNGKIESLKQWNGFPYNESVEDVSQMSDYELANMLMFSDRDRKENDRAERVYWLCIAEINARIEKDTWKD